MWRALHDALPHESLVYLGDGARCPYGSKSEEEIGRYAEEAVERLLAEGCKLIVVACNTATAVAIKALREQYHAIPFVGLEPAVKPAALTTRTGIIGVLATERSLQGDHFRQAEARYGSEVQIVKAVGEGFVEAVERNEEQSAETEALVRRVIEPIVAAGADKIVLGCTHYPFLRDVIAKVAGEGVEIIDSAAAVARRVISLLEEHNLASVGDAVAEYRFLSFADEAYCERLRAKAEASIVEQKY